MTILEPMADRDLLISIRTSLGLSGDALAQMLGNDPRTIRRWESDSRPAPVPPGVWDDITDLEARAERDVEDAITAARGAVECGSTPRITIDSDSDTPVGWQRMIAGHVHRVVPDLIVNSD